MDLWSPHKGREKQLYKTVLKPTGSLWYCAHAYAHTLTQEMTDVDMRREFWISLTLKQIRVTVLFAEMRKKEGGAGLEKKVNAGNKHV